MKKNIFNKIIFYVVIIIFIFASAALIFTKIIEPRLDDFLPQFLRGTVLVPFHEHFSLDESVPQLILDSERLRHETAPVIENRDGIPRVFLSASFLKNHIDPFVFWDEGAEILFISTLSEMLEFSPESDYFLLNGSPTPLEHSVFEKDGEIFLPVSLVLALYPLTVEFQPLFNMVVVTTDAPQTTATVSAKRAEVHYWPSSRPVTARLNEGDEIFIFPNEPMNYPDAENAHEFVRARTADGLLGYVLRSQIEETNSSTLIKNFRGEPILKNFINNKNYPEKIFRGGAVNLVWEAVYHPDANRSMMQTPFHPSVNVVSPKWFRINDDGKSLNSIASKEYVDWAKAQGVAVWPMVFDMWYTQSRLMLTDRDARRTVINQLIEFVELFELDGLNIDFEHLTANEGAYKIQFLRELAIPMRERGIVLSADVKVPIPSTAFYRRDLIAKTVDFVMVMAYDEHWSTSPTAGPNASLPFVLRGVENMLEEVPNNRLVLGLPFYNRIWRTVPSTGEVSHHGAFGTNSTRKFFEERNGNFFWDEYLGTHFGEASAFDEGESVVFQTWLEDARSMQEKMHIYNDFNLAGVASWNRTFSIDEFWEVISKYFEAQ
ncbi:MAG: glycosyl hydrolase family 18 protein [Defluviitaleaceae bacterium]|nr:glycosyl hydrolase family 18 protein [Defluviitaleaceae bacterium]